jgi:hypothetical protein
VPESGFKFEKIDVARNGTSATFDLNGNVHGWSTEELEFSISYNDPVDDLNEHRRKTEAAAHDAKIADLHPYYIDTVPINGWYATEDLEFHDTKCHIVEITAVAKTRYADFFPNAMAPKSVGNTNRRQVRGAGTIVVRSDEGEVGAYTKTYYKQNVIVPSSKRPDKPQVEYVLPAMTWATESTPTGKVSRKRGNTVRVFLRRPWFSSGAGEKLGIVLNDSSSSHTGTPDYPYHSALGLDPAFEFPEGFKILVPEHFVGSSGVVRNVQIPELGQATGSSALATATLVTYNPEFDSNLQLWYVDVEIDPQCEYYTPFLRLALCRYQPNSTEGNFVSPVVVTEITQLQPDRVVVVHTVEARKAFQIYYAGIPGRSAKSENVVIGALETQAPNSPDAPWLPVMKDNDAFEFIVRNVGQSSGALNGVSNVFEWAGHAENIAKLTGGRPPMILNIPSTPGEYRFVLREYEIHPSLTGEPPVAVNNPGIAGRLIHADVVYLTTNGPVIRGRRDQV